MLTKDNREGIIMRVLEVIKDKVLLLIGWFKAVFGRITASDKEVSESEHDRVLSVQLQDELSWYRQEYEQQLQDMGVYIARLTEVGKTLREIAGILLKAGVPYETIYALVAVELDRGGWRRFSVAKRLIPENIYTYFYAEDCLGKFENMEGDELLYWLELTKFGVLEHYFQGSYEMVGSHRLRSEDKDYTDYRKRLHRLVLDDLLKEKQAVSANPEMAVS